MKYGDKPTPIGCINIDCKEMMFYQYLPIKMIKKYAFQVEERLQVFLPLIELVVSDFETKFGTKEMIDSYVYLTVKRQFVSKNKRINRPGYHSDGFLTDDINYIWSDENPTVFNTSEFKLSQDDEVSLKEMTDQALIENEIIFPNNTILRLNQFNIHKVNEDSKFEGLRTFVKVSFSKDKYDLEGNSHNYELHYNWEMKPRKLQRNIPQSNLQNDERKVTNR